MIAFFSVLVAVSFASLVLQFFIPPLPSGAQVMLLPLVLFYGALSLPVPLMLALAFIGGLMWDALHVQIIDGNVEIAMGWSIVLYATLCSIMSGFRPLYQRGRWELHCLLAGVLTTVIVLVEYLMITFRREPVFFLMNREIGWRIGGSGIAALLMAPFVFYGLNYLANVVGYDPQPERKVKR